MKTNKMLMAEARDVLRGKWGAAVFATLLYLVVSGIAEAIPGVGNFIGLLIGGPFALGLAIYWINLSRGNAVNIEMIFVGFKDFGKSAGLFILMGVYVLLWSLLLVIPGILAVLSYSMAFYILADNRNLGPREVLSKSKEMMKGNRGKLALLTLRFTGWIILSVLTLGIGMLWLFPYMSVASVKFYEDLKNKTVPKPTV